MNVVSLNNVSLDGNVIRKGGSSGGGSSAVTSSVSDVNFYDYDGTILHSYTKEQFLALSAMPELPTREGLICQGWNWTFDEAKEYVTDYGMLDIGTMYITDDGDTRLYIRIATEGRMTVPLRWSQTVANGVSVDWGDGSAIQTFTFKGNISTTHTYTNPGGYVIRLKVADGCKLGLGTGYSCVIGSTDENIDKVYRNMLQKAEIGARITSIGGYAFQNCHSLKSISIPSSVTDISDYAFCYCYSLASVSISNGVTSIGKNAFYSCYSLASVSISNGVTSIGKNAFYSCYSLAPVSIPSSITSIGDSVFYGCYSLALVAIPSSITSISGYAFYGCYGMAIYDFTNHTSVPTLSNTNAFSNIPSDCVIKVPSSLLEEWKAATNWSKYASQIVGV